MKTTVIYFSPTGGTKKAVTALGHLIDPDCQSLDLTDYDKRQTSYTFGGDELAVIASPVYGGQIPAIPGLYRNLYGKQTPCVLMAAYGNRHYDDTPAQLKHILENQGFLCVAAIACVIPHIYSDRLGAGRPDGEDLEVFHSFKDSLIQKLQRQDFTSPALPGDETPPPKEIKPVSKHREEALCTRCLACARACPVQCIDDPTLSWDLASCVNCMRCTRACPSGALTFDAGDVKEYLESNYLIPRKVEIFL